MARSRFLLRKPAQRGYTACSAFCSGLIAGLPAFLFVPSWSIHMAQIPSAPAHTLMGSHSSRPCSSLPSFLTLLCLTPGSVLPFSLSGMLSCQISSWLLPYFIQGSIQKLPAERPSLIAHHRRAAFHSQSFLATSAYSVSHSP